MESAQAQSLGCSVKMSPGTAVIWHVSSVPLQMKSQGTADSVLDIDAQEHCERWGLNPPIYVLHVPVM
jgi:hypothetical protein